MKLQHKQFIDRFAILHSEIWKSQLKIIYYRIKHLSSSSAFMCRSKKKITVPQKFCSHVAEAIMLWLQEIQSKRLVSGDTSKVKILWPDIQIL